MSTTLIGKDEVVINVNVRTTGSVNVTNDQYRTGTPLLPAMDQVWRDGTGSGQAQKHYYGLHTLAGSASTTLDLSSLGGGFTKVKRLALRLRNAAAGVKIVVGNAASNPFAPWASSATVTEDVADLLYRRSAVDGWTVSGSAKNIKVENPGAASVSFDVSVVGL